MSKQGQVDYIGHDKIHFEGTAMRCGGCDVLETKKDEYAKFPTLARKYGVRKVVEKMLSRG